MEDFPLFGEGDYGDFGDGLLADMSPAGMDDAGGMFDLDQLYQNWLADGNEGSFAEFKNTLDNATDSSSDSDASGSVTGLDAGGSLTDGLKAFEGDGLLSPKPMIELSRPEAAPAPPPVSAASTPVSGNVGKGPSAFQEIGPRIKSDLMRDFGLSTAQAAGIVGNLAHESGGFGTLQEINPMIPGSRGGYGYAQWTGPRRRQFESWAAENKLDPASYDANYGFLKHELANTSEGRVLDRIGQTNDPTQATRIFSDVFLRPGIPGMDSREKWTQRALAFSQQPQMASGLPAVTPGPGAQQASLSNADPRPYRGQLNSIPSDGIGMIYGPYRGPSGEIGEIRGPYRGELNGIPSDELVRPIPYRRQLNDIPSNELVRPAAVRPVEGDIANANQLEADARYYDRTNPEAAAQLRARAAMARGGNGQAQSGNAGMPASGAQPDLRMAGIGAVPVNPNGFAPARLPKLEPNTTPMGPGTYAVTQAELTGDTAGLLSPNMAIPGNVPLANVPTMRGAIDPGYIYQDAVRTLPAQAPPPPPPPPGARPNTSRTQVAGDPPPNARSKNPPASSAVETRGRSMTPQNQLPPEYFTADTGGSGMGAMRFMESEFARREGQQPPTFGGIGAAISNGMSGVGQAINSAIGGAPVQASVGTAPPGQASGRIAPVVDERTGPPRPNLNPFGFWGESAEKNRMLLAEWEGQKALVEQLVSRGVPRERALGAINNNAAMQLALEDAQQIRDQNRNAEIRERTQRALQGAEAPTSSSPSGTPAAPAPSSVQTPSASPPAAPSNQVDATRARLTNEFAILNRQLADARSTQEVEQLNRLIKANRDLLSTLPDPLEREKKVLENRKLTQELDGGKDSRDVANREKEIKARNLDPKDPRWQSYILTGRLPREDAQPLTATDKKAILEADEGVLAAETAIKALKEAKEISPRALGGVTAPVRTFLGNNLPDILLPDVIASPQQAQDTASLNNLVVSNALSQLKAIFGGAPTEGERKILLEIQGSVSQPDNVRQEIYSRAASMAEKRLQFNKERASQLRGGDYYKAQPAPRNEATPPPAAPNRAALEEAARAEARRRGLVQ